MNRISFVSLGIITLIATQIHATTFKTTGTSTVKDQGVDIYPTAEVTVGEGDSAKTYPLYLSGYGTRKKLVGIFNVKTYEATSYTEVKDITKSDNPLEDVKKSKLKVLKLDLLMALSAEKLRSSFEDALTVNDVDITKGPVKDLLDQLTFGLPSKSTVILLAIPGDTGAIEKVEIQLKDKVLGNSGDNLGYDFWKIWFVKVAEGDTGMQELQDQLIGKPKP